MKMPNIERAIVKAAENGHAAAVSTLLSFSLQQGLEASSVITRWAVDTQHLSILEYSVTTDGYLIKLYSNTKLK